MHFLIIGVGSIGERHLKNFLRVDAVRCSIAEPHERRQRVADENKVEKAYADYRDADLSGFDGVVICAPAHLHVRMALDIVKAGTHVLTEKPLSVSLDGVDDLKRLRDEKGVVISVAFPLRSNPLTRELKQVVDSNRLGSVRFVNYYAGQYWPDCRRDYPPQYAQSRDTGGGAIPDHLVHHANHLEWVLGPVEAVSAHHWRKVLDDIATEDLALVTLRFKSGAIGHLGTCLFQKDMTMRLQIAADRGTLRLEDDDKTIQIFDADQGRWTPGKEQMIDRDDIFVSQARHFIDCIEGRARPRCTVEEAEATLRTVLAALESADGDGRWVNVG